MGESAIMEKSYRQSIQFGNMFCPKCGKENPDTNQFCVGCGVNLTYSSIPPPPQSQKYRSSPDVFGIFFGLAILFSMYMLPIVPKGKYSVTLADLAYMCSNPLSQAMYGCSETGSVYVLYGGWIVALFFIIAGLFHKVEE